MKKLIALALALACVSLGACSLKKDVPTFEDIQDYTEEDFEIYLNRIKRDALIEAWGGSRAKHLRTTIQTLGR